MRLRMYASIPLSSRGNPAVSAPAEVHDLEQVDARNFDHRAALAHGEFGLLVADKQPCSLGSLSVGNGEAHLLRADGEDLAYRALQHHRVGEVDDRERQAVLVLAQREIDDALALDGDARR